MKRTLIIAEAGVNHNGSIELAKQLVDAAAEAGADYVKFQTFKAEKLVTREAKKAEYQIKNLKDSKDDTQYTMLKKLELSEADHSLLLQYTNSKNIKFLSTAFDLDSLEFLADLGIKIAKIPSGEITNLPYLEKAARLFPDIVLSTGMANMEEIDKALKVLFEGGTKKERITVLHCNTEYPTLMKDVNLKAMLHIQEKFDVKIGYSDHTLGVEVPIAAVALGASIIEKHFTLNRNLEGPDHKASLEPQELKEMVRSIRNIELALNGSGFKEPSESELKNILLGRKSIHLAINVKKGETIRFEHLIMKRPGDGISPFEIKKIVGKNYNHDLMANHKIDWVDFK